MKKSNQASSVEEIEQAVESLSLEDLNKNLREEIELNFTNKVVEKIDKIFGVFFDKVNSELQEITDKIDRIYLRVDSRENITKELTKKSGSNQKGRIPNCQLEEINRHYRSYKNDREKQILRHIATQLYFAIQYYLKKEKLSLPLVEIQAMHLSCEGRHNLFIVANEFSVTKTFTKIINKDNFKESLTWFYSPEDSEGKKRSKRYASKLKKRVFGNSLQITGNDPVDVKNAEQVGDILRDNNIVSLQIGYGGDKLLNEESRELLSKIIQSEDKTIFFVTVRNYPGHKGRHAEEFLCDIVDYSKELEVETIYTAIAGKKRPCIGCSGRLEAVNVSNYGRYPGRFWKHTFETQSEDVALKTLNLLRKNSSYISICENGESKATDYDSGSNSEGEVYEEMPKFTVG